ncbi:F-box/LRR-repeat protein 12 [Leptosomus discolor]
MAEGKSPEVSALPDSVLLRVLALLPLRDRLRAARVCRRWQRLALDRAVWTHVDLSPHRITLRTLWHLLRQRFPGSLRTLRLRGALLSGREQPLLSAPLLAALAKRCPQLRRLCLAELNLRPIPYESLPPSLTALELSHCEIPAAWFGSAALPGLQHLVLHNVPAFSDRHLLGVSSRSRLRALSLAGTYRLTDTGLQRAAPHLRHLERLVLCRCPLGDAALGGLGRHAQRLRFLELGDAPAVTDAGLAALTALRRLETLCLDLGGTVSPGAVVALGQALPRLRNLRLSGARLDDEGIDQIRASLPHCSFSHAPPPTA